MSTYEPTLEAYEKAAVGAGDWADAHATGLYYYTLATAQPSCIDGITAALRAAYERGASEATERAERIIAEHAAAARMERDTLPTSEPVWYGQDCAAQALDDAGRDIRARGKR